ncbi:hypothetical protein DBR28_16730 [Chryseobacterium sp. HMWF028]|nr:hypothetical protein DBR28_16730 [Chryseobacterium sp. HMWF028]
MILKKISLIGLLSVNIGLFAQAGNVGINTTTPGTTLDVNGAITNRETTVAVSGNAVTVPANVSQVQLTGAATAAVTITAPAAPNAGQRLVIFNNTTGGFGASLNGVTIPNGKALEYVYSNSGWRSTDGGAVGAAGVNIYNTDGSLTNNRTVSQGANTLTFTGNQVNAFSVDGNTLSVDAANHRIGIGTSTPDTPLTVQTPDNNFGIRHTNGTISLKSYIGGGKAYFGTTTPNDLYLVTNNTNQATITSAGNFGIRTNAPDHTLDVNGNVRFRSVASVTSADNSGILLADGVGAVSQISTNDFVGSLKIPANLFNAEQTTNISTDLPGNLAKNTVVFGTVNLNAAGGGTWNAANNTYTVSKAGIYQITAGVELANVTTTNYGLYISAGPRNWTIAGNPQAGSIMVFAGTYVKLLAVGDIIYCYTQSGNTTTYRQNTAFMHIVYTPL